MPDARPERDPGSINAEFEQIERILRNSLERASVEYAAAREKYLVALKRFSSRG